MAMADTFPTMFLTQHIRANHEWTQLPTEREFNALIEVSDEITNRPFGSNT